MSNGIAQLPAVPSDSPVVYDFEQFAPAYDIESKDGCRWRVGGSGPMYLVHDPSPLDWDAYEKKLTSVAMGFCRTLTGVVWEVTALNERCPESVFTSAQVAEMVVDWLESFLISCEVPRRDEVTA
jgi:hypothetical protein